MQSLLITIFTLSSIASFWQFLRGKYRLSPLWIMLSVWFLAIAISQLHLSSLELVWPGKFRFLIFVSLASFSIGFFVFSHPRFNLGSTTIIKTIWFKLKKWIPAFAGMEKKQLSVHRLRYVIYCLFLISCYSLYLFYHRAGNFPLFAQDPDAFRFAADEKVPGLINYCAQLARIFIPLSFFLIFSQRFSWRKHGDITLISLIGAISLILFTSRTQIFFIDLWVMALYLFMRKPNLKQALKFYPAFLLVSILVLSAVPLYRQYRSYGSGYLAGVTAIDTTHFNPIGKALLPIYVGVSFNQQALLHAWQYYQTHELQHGKVSLDLFTNIFGKVFHGLNKYKSHYDLGQIFYSWWNTGTYLFPFVQDFGTAAFYFVPFVIAGILTLLWRYWQSAPNFLSINLYAYAMFFIVMTVYLSFTVRAEMYLDLMLLFGIYLFVSKHAQS